jgi:hypothetical protein
MEENLRLLRRLLSPFVLALGIYMTWLYFSFGPAPADPQDQKLQVLSLQIKNCNKEWFAVSDEVSYFLKPFPKEIETFYSGDKTHETGIQQDIETREIDSPLPPKRNSYNLNHYFPGFIASFLGIVFVLLFFIGFPLGALYCFVEAITWETKKGVFELFFALGGFLFCVFFVLHFRQTLDYGAAITIDNPGERGVEITCEGGKHSFFLPAKSRVRLGLEPGPQQFTVKNPAANSSKTHRIYISPSLAHPANRQIIFNIDEKNTYRFIRKSYRRR